MLCKRRPALLLDRNFATIRSVPWKKAMQLVFGRAKAEVVAFYENSINEYDLSVIRLLHYVAPNSYRNAKTRFCRKHVFTRDKFQCMYCGSDRKSDLTVDHILPKSRGGPTTYTNCVTSCIKCNQKKGNRTPEEAGMTLTSAPTTPIKGRMLRITDLPQEWAIYLIGQLYG